MASSLDQERIEFESHAGQMSLEQLTESLKANEKLIQLFELQKGAIPQVLEMMQTVLKQELKKKTVPELNLLNYTYSFWNLIIRQRLYC